MAFSGLVFSIGEEGALLRSDNASVARCIETSGASASPFGVSPPSGDIFSVLGGIMVESERISLS